MDKFLFDFFKGGGHERLLFFFTTNLMSIKMPFYVAAYRSVEIVCVQKGVVLLQ